MKPIPGLHVLIMAGGSGSRFWPLSMPDHPKQFLSIPPITGESSLLQLTIDRVRPLIAAENIWIIGLEPHRQLIEKNARDLPKSNLIYEPFGKNTAASVIVGAKLLVDKDPDAKVLVLPADHFIENSEVLLDLVQRGCELLNDQERLVTFGIAPRWAETGYGYIERGDELASSIFSVRAFREKPSAKVAQSYLDQGGFYWNSGMFLWSAKILLEEAARHCPEVFNPLDAISFEDAGAYGFSIPVEPYESVPKISVDFAIMERSTRCAVIEAPLEWSDLGGWDAVYELLQRDGNNNAAAAKRSVLQDSSRNLVYCPGKEVIVSGVEDLVIAVQNDRILISRLGASSSTTRELVERMLKKD